MVDHYEEHSCPSLAQLHLQLGRWHTSPHKSLSFDGFRTSLKRFQIFHFTHHTEDIQRNFNFLIFLLVQFFMIDWRRKKIEIKHPTSRAGMIESIYAVPNVRNEKPFQSNRLSRQEYIA